MRMEEWYNAPLILNLGTIWKKWSALHTVRVTRGGKDADARWTLEKRKISYPYQETNHDFTVVHPEA
jgi:hypothetical protein